MQDDAQSVRPTKKFQFSLNLLLGAMLYSAALATACVNLAGVNFNPIQTAAAYFVTILCVVGFSVMSKARGKIAAYVLLSPMVFVASIVVATMFRSSSPPVTIVSKTTIATTPVTTQTPTIKNVPQPRQSPGAVEPPLKN